MTQAREAAKLMALLEAVVRRALDEELAGPGSALSWFVLNEVAPQMAKRGAP